MASELTSEVKTLAAKPAKPRLIPRAPEMEREALPPAGLSSDPHMPAVAHLILIIYFRSLVLVSVWLFLLK